MKLDTERLELIVLDAPQLRLWFNDLPALEKELDCTYKAEALEGHFLEIIQGQAKLTEENAEKYYWYSFWFLIRKSDRTVVGSADFKKGPNDKGEVEIGYGLGKEFEHNGYMTEAVRAMCAWAKQQPDIAYVTAETLLDNQPSQNILKRCGFVETSRGETLWWKV
ncbi:MAG: GNAT family N-acetyltransferase [Firmicutes bacterium HGW-Firmicutes-16]|nr:MAG: GNAT family N-acetyltransferase [Firmicutes bacterium HGW-Firmicutes-16]